MIKKIHFYLLIVSIKYTTYNYHRINHKKLTMYHHTGILSQSDSSLDTINPKISEMVKNDVLSFNFLKKWKEPIKNS